MKHLNDNEILYRQIHPNFLINGRVSSQAFRPTPKDKSCLSLDRKALTEAKDSYLNYKARGLPTVGVLELEVKEFQDQNIDCIEDPQENNTAHALANYSNLNNASQKKAGKKLANLAWEKGWAHNPNT